MKSTIYIAMLACGVLVTAQYYSSKFENINVQEIIGNKRILQNYINCFLDTGSCVPIAKELKDLLPEVLATTCGKCSPKQKEILRSMCCAVRKQVPDDWAKMEKKYDPTGKHRVAFNKFLNC